MRKLILFLLLVAVAYAQPIEEPAPQEPVLHQPPKAGETGQVSTTTGLTYTVLRPGQGESVHKGETVKAHYTGWLRDGTKFDSSLDRGEPLDFQVGVGMVIPGWHEVGGDQKALHTGQSRLRQLRSGAHPPQLGAGLRSGARLPPIERNSLR